MILNLVNGLQVLDQELKINFTTQLHTSYTKTSELTEIPTKDTDDLVVPSVQTKVEKSDENSVVPSVENQTKKPFEISAKKSVSFEILVETSAKEKTDFGVREELAATGPIKNINETHTKKSKLKSFRKKPISNTVNLIRNGFRNIWVPFRRIFTKKNNK